MTEKANKESKLDRRLSRLARDTTRISALTLLNEQTADLVEVAEYLGVGKRAAKQHLEQMLAAGLIELIEAASEDSEPRYRALEQLLWDDEKWEALGEEERQRLSAWIVAMIGSDVSDAIAAGTFDARTEGHASRMVSMLDEKGWLELVKVQNEALEESFAIQAAAAERLAENGEEGFPALSAMICCELPPGSKTTD